MLTFVFKLSYTVFTIICLSHLHTEKSSNILNYILP